MSYEQHYSQDDDIDKTFGAKLSEAVNRQKRAEQALSKIGADEFHTVEGTDSTDVDAKGIDAVTEINGEQKFVSLKTRNVGSTERGIKDIDLSLRIQGRQGRPSEEWRRFVSESDPVPHILVFLLFDDEEVAEVNVIDFKRLKELYKQSEQEILTHWQAGYVPAHPDGQIQSSPPVGSKCDDQGVFMFIDKSNIISSDATIFHFRV